ncbi:MAG TPA: hypothetical protein VNF04_04925, partial [Stellaceae bacterium]|nr:hypothetical protein [Stellaceae bacterium]
MKRSRLLRHLGIFGITIALAACAVQGLTAAEVPSHPGGRLMLTPTDFAQLPGWTDDDVAAALPAFL